MTLGFRHNQHNRRIVMSSKRNRRYRLQRIAVAVSLSLTAAGAQARVDTLVLSGQAAPDGNGVFSSFSSAQINASGQVAFSAQLSGTADPTLGGSGIFRAIGGSPLTQIARSGAPAPGNGIISFVSLPSDSALNNAGQVAFSANLTATSGGFSD